MMSRMYEYMNSAYTLQIATSTAVTTHSVHVSSTGRRDRGRDRTRISRRARERALQ